MTQHWITRAVSYLPHPETLDVIVLALAVCAGLWLIGECLK
jgi:hypothetical protein